MYWTKGERVYTMYATIDVRTVNVQIVTISHWMTVFPSPAELRRNRSTHETTTVWLWLHKCPTIPVFYHRNRSYTQIMWVTYCVYQRLLDKHISLRDMNQLFHLDLISRKFPRWSQALDTDAWWFLWPKGKTSLEFCILICHGNPKTLHFWGVITTFFWGV